MGTDTHHDSTSSSGNSEANVSLSSGLGIAWALAMLSGGYGTGDLVASISVNESASTQDTTEEVFVVTSSDLVQAFVDLGNRIEARSAPMEPDVRDVLYDNLWDLYQA